MSDLRTRIEAWFWGRPVKGEVTQHADQVLTMLHDLRLVVIDPEDREAVERFAEVYDAVYARRHPATYCDAPPLDEDADSDLMQAALREFADPKPPKPDEPTGLGAVVEDAEGVLWVRCNRYEPWLSAQDTDRRKWSDIAAVRVLSEGVDA